ncbi:MAG: hypothetical protein RL009_808 [Actinomycetota bacterium]
MRILDVFAPNRAEQIELVPLSVEHLEPYLEMLGDEEGRRLTATTAKFDRQQIVDWLASRATVSNRKDWAILTATDDFVGQLIFQGDSVVRRLP